MGMSRIPYFLTPDQEDQQPDTMAPIAGQAMSAMGANAMQQNPAHALTAPISPAPPEVMSPKVTQDMNPEDQMEGHAQNKLMADYRKDANPYGSPNNHPGFLGKFLHGLNMVERGVLHGTGQLTQREQEERDLEKQLGGIEKDKAEEGLQGAQTGHLNAETPEVAPNAASNRNVQSAEARHLNDESDALESPTPQYEVHDTAIGPLFINKQTGQAQHLSVDGQPVGPKLSLKESQPLMGDDGKPHTYMIDDKGNKVVDLGVHYERPISINTGAREDRAEKNDLLKAYQPTLDSAERMNVMTESYEKAIKNHDQQAMLNLLANHLGMTMGLQKGARLTKDIINEAKQSQPWLQGIQSKFDKDGYLAGVTLSPNQMRQMVDLGQERYAEDTKKSRSTAQYLGAKDDGPERVPGKATINFYLSKAGGDPAKAKQLAAQDGWSVK